MLNHINNNKGAVINHRINLSIVEPEAFQLMLQFEDYLKNSELTQKHIDIIKIRASQLNGCAFCVDKHTRDARSAGETEQRIYALSVWRDTPLFSEEERIILALTEEITFITKRVSDNRSRKNTWGKIPCTGDDGNYSN